MTRFVFTVIVDVPEGFEEGHCMAGQSAPDFLANEIYGCLEQFDVCHVVVTYGTPEGKPS